MHVHVSISTFGVHSASDNIYPSQALKPRLLTNVTTDLALATKTVFSMRSEDAFE